MGWLRPEEGLINPEHGDLAAHRRVAQPLAELPVRAFGSVVIGTRVHGSRLEHIEVRLDDGFEHCPLLARAGYPLMLKREPAAAAEANAEERALKVFVYRLMSARGEGLSPLWQVGDAPLPPLLAAFADGEPLYPHEWTRLRRFYDDFAPLPVQLQAVDAEGGPDTCRSEDDFEAALRRWAAPSPGDPRFEAFAAATAKRPAVGFGTLAARFPIGSRVEAQDLKRAALNSLVGLVARHDEMAGRVGVRFAPPHGLLALQPKNLIPLPDKPAAPAAAAPSPVDCDEGVDAF